MQTRKTVTWVVAAIYGVAAATAFVMALLGTPETTAAGVAVLLLAVPWSLLVLLVVTNLGIGPTSVTFVLVSLGLVINLGLLVSVARRGAPAVAAPPPP